MTIISSLSLSMSNHLKKSCFDYFLLDDSPSRMVKRVKEKESKRKLWLKIVTVHYQVHFPSQSHYMTNHLIGKYPMP